MWCFWTREALKTETISICFQPSDEKAPRVWAVWASFCGETWSLEYGIWMDIIDIIGNLQNLMEINGNIGKPMEKIWQHPLGSIWIFLTFGIGSWAGCSNRRPPWGRCRWSRWSLSSHSLNKLPKFVSKVSQTLSLSFHKFETWISVEHCGTLYLELKWRIHMNSTFRKKHELQVPVFFYGAAREDCRNSMEFRDHGRNSWRIHVEDLRSMAELRRCLGCATVSVHCIRQIVTVTDSDSGRYFSGAAKGEWCQPENVDRFFIIFHVFNFWNFKHRFSMFFCIFLSDFHQVFS